MMRHAAEMPYKSADFFFSAIFAQRRDYLRPCRRADASRRCIVSFLPQMLRRFSAAIMMTREARVPQRRAFCLIYASIYRGAILHALFRAELYADAAETPRYMRYVILRDENIVPDAPGLSALRPDAIFRRRRLLRADAAFARCRRALTRRGAEPLRLPTMSRATRCRPPLR